MTGLRTSSSARSDVQDILSRLVVEGCEIDFTLYRSQHNVVYDVEPFSFLIVIGV